MEKQLDSWQRPDQAGFRHGYCTDDHLFTLTALQEKCNELGIRGSLLLATEGINGTIAGTSERIEKILCYIKNMPGCADLEYKTRIIKSRIKNFKHLKRF